MFNSSMYDIVGDIHGHCEALKSLLLKLGYTRDGSSWGHPDRKVIFVGDYIDRGPKIPETLELVRSMTDNDQAIALMGNHELNAILFNEKDGEGGYVRPRTQKNIDQHKHTLEQFEVRAKGLEEYEEYIHWFRSLPMTWENEYLRAVHATWHPESVEALEDHAARIREHGEYLARAGDPHHELWSLTETLLKGIEESLPEGVTFTDKHGTQRDEMRIKWWKDPAQTPIEHYGFDADLSGHAGKTASDLVTNRWHYEDRKPVFFGHYWLRGEPALQSPYVCCLDYSIGKKEKLAAYRYDGEEELYAEKLVWVEYVS
ncbi:metallophosphoesterase [Balneola sp. MJW-20]|uniref:metallophosphoesterase n=1 Tax=Gracilimonas aurantiaca TaxID=3234185 RepID=UPI00390918A5